jgi:demethylmenaquinone methyltransferase/2-methoxy-6-polyprenyl-1,4-benzoquinol methylase
MHTVKPEHERTTGARPLGATTEQSAAQNVQQMFDNIAPTYDRANHILSIGLDRWMWSRAARTFRPILQQPEATALDLCCGTGDMTLALYKHRPKWVPPDRPQRVPHDRRGPTAPIVGSVSTPAPDAPNQQPATNNQQPLLAIDFSHQMLTLGAQKFANLNILPIEADALHLPIASASIDLVTSAFGFRNLANYEEGLAEILRILRPDGQLGILECNQPEGIIGAAYNLYFKGILPHVGALISGQPAAYNYLPASVERFPHPPRMLQLLRNAGFTNPTWTSYALGTAGLYRATKP